MITKYRNNQNITHIWGNDNLLLILLFIFCIVTIYFLPFSISIAIFFFLFPFFIFNSKKDYFWLAFFFVLLDAPGHLFKVSQEQLYLSSKQIPYILVGYAQSINFKDIIPFVFFIKAIVKKNNIKYKFVFKDDFKFFLIYFLTVLVISIVTQGLYYGKYYKLLVILGYWSLIFSLPKLLNYEQMKKLDKLLFPFVFIGFILQLLPFFSGKELIHYFNPNYSGYAWTLHVKTTLAARIFSNMYITLYCLFRASFYSLSSKKEFPSFYMLLVIILSILSFFLTATRSWILATIISSLLLILFVDKSIKKIMKFSFFLMFMGFILISIFIAFPRIKNQAENAWTRFSTISYIIEGDLTADNTLIRLTDRRYPMEDKFKENPIWGWGFSDIFFNVSDDHLGLMVNLLNVGILGLIIYLFYLFKWLLNIWQYSKTKYVRNIFGNSFIVFAVALVFIFILHLSSHTMWGFYINDKRALFMLILIFISFNTIILYSQEFMKKYL